MGGTEKLGTGVNIQAKLKTLHHIDAPWRPSDMEQREGRILRQGNENPSVEILRYGVDRSFDANAYQRLDMKERFIKSIMNGTNTDREAEDAGVEAITSFADAFAAISGNPLVRERFDLETRIRHLERLQFQFEEDQTQAHQHLRSAKSEADYSQRIAAEIRRQAAVLVPAFANPDRVSAKAPDDAAEGKEEAYRLLDHLLKKHMGEVSLRLSTQINIDQRTGDVRDRNFSVSIPPVAINGLPVNLDCQIQYRAPDTNWPERLGLFWADSSRPTWSHRPNSLMAGSSVRSRMNSSTKSGVCFSAYFFCAASERFSYRSPRNRVPSAGSAKS